MNRFFLLIGAVFILMANAGAQTTVTLPISDAQTAFYDSPNYWCYTPSFSTAQHLGLIDPTSGYGKRARLLFNNPNNRPNSQIQSIKIRINAQANYTNSTGTARCFLSLNNLVCDNNLSWNLTGSGGINSDQREIYNCIYGSTTYGYEYIDRNSSSTQTDYVIYNRDPVQTNNDPYVGANETGFVVNINDGYGSMWFNSIQAIVTYDDIQPQAPVLNFQNVTTSQVTLSWNAVANANGYHIYTASGTTPIASTSGTSYTINGLSSCNQFSYRVKAYNNSLTSSYSNTVSGYTSSNIAVQSSNVQQTQCNVNIVSPVPNATTHFYNSNGSLLLSLPPGQNSGVLSGLTPGSTNIINVITTGNSCSVNPYSFNVTTLLATPVIGSFSVVTSTSGDVYIQNVNGADHIYIYDATTGSLLDNFSIVGTQSGIFHTVGNLSPSSFASIRIKAARNGVLTNFSNTMSIIMPWADMSQISEYTLISSSQIHLYWPAVPNAVSYNVYYKVSGSGGQPVLYGSPSSTSIMVSGLQTLTSYTFYIYPVNGASDEGVVSYYASSTDGRGGAGGGGSSSKTTGIDRGLIDNSFIVSPNPLESQLYLSGPDFDAIQLLDMTGKIVLVGDGSQHSIDVSMLESGVYLLKIHSSDQWIQKRVVKN